MRHRQVAGSERITAHSEIVPALVDLLLASGAEDEVAQNDLCHVITFHA